MSDDPASAAAPGPLRGMARLEARVFGRVQGVGYRAWVVKIASRAGLDGWVANEAGGSVRCVAEGPRAALDELLAALRRGPASATVTTVAAAWSVATGEFSDFSTRMGWHAGD